MSSQPSTLRKTVRVSSEIGRGETLPSLTKTKGFRALLLLAESRGTVVKGDIYEIPQQTLRELLRCNDDAHLRNELETLAGLKVNWSRVDPDGGGYSIPVSSCTWGKTGQVRFAFDPQFVEAWQNNQLGFRRINWEVLVSFRSLYAAKIYEYVCLSHEQGRIVKTKRQTITELRELLGVPPTAYSGGNSGRFFQEIAKAVRQVNDAQDGLRVAVCREGRGTSARFWFEVEDAPRQDRMPLTNPTQVVTEGGTRRARIEAALAALPAEKREEVLTQMVEIEKLESIPNDDMGLKIYAGRLRDYGVEI